MKKIFNLSSIAIAALLAMTACSNEIEGESTAMDNTIEVNAMVGSDVAARATTAVAPEDATTTTADLAGFTLDAWLTYGTKLIDGAAYTKANGKFAKTGAPTYWPVGTLTFVAQANNNGTTTMPIALTEDETGVSGSYVIEKSTKVTAEDVLALQNDPVLAVNLSAKPVTSNAVSLTFQHLLSRVGVNIYAPKYNTNTVRVLDFGFSEVAVKGDFAYNYATTSTTFATSTWTVDAEDDAAVSNIGQYGALEQYWWESAAGPIIPGKEVEEENRVLDAKLTGTPWLNVIPGAHVATNLQVRFEVLQAEGTETTPSWHAKTATLAIPEETLDAYKPGYEYIYNVRILGQNSDDATIAQAQIELISITVQPWNTQSLGEQESTNAGDGKTLQMLIDDAKALGTHAVIKLSKDVVIEKTVTVDSNVSIDLNGHDITAKDDDVTPLIDVKKGGKLTIDDKSAGTPGTVTPAAGGTAIAVEGGAEAVLKGGNYDITGNEGAHIVETFVDSENPELKGKATVTGGTYQAGEGSAPFFGDGIELLEGGTYGGGFVPSVDQLPAGFTYYLDANGQPVVFDKSDSFDVPTDDQSGNNIAESHKR